MRSSSNAGGVAAAFRGHGEVSLYALQYGGYVTRPVQPLRQVDDASSRPLAEVDSQVSGKADLE
jgi:hypothetical protein